MICMISPITGQPIDINRPGGGRGYGRGGGSGRTPMSAAPPGQQGHWQGGRTPIAAGDSNRTPAWNAGSARSKYIVFSYYMIACFFCFCC